MLDKVDRETLEAKEPPCGIPHLLPCGILLASQARGAPYVMLDKVDKETLAAKEAKEALGIAQSGERSANDPLLGAAVGLELSSRYSEEERDAMRSTNGTNGTSVHISIVSGDWTDPPPPGLSVRTVRGSHSHLDDACSGTPSVTGSALSVGGSGSEPVAVGAVGIEMRDLSEVSR